MNIVEDLMARLKNAVPNELDKIHDAVSGHVLNMTGTMSFITERLTQVRDQLVSLITQGGPSSRAFGQQLLLLNEYQALVRAVDVLSGIAHIDGTPANVPLVKDRHA